MTWIGAFSGPLVGNPRAQGVVIGTDGDGIGDTAEGNLISGNNNDGIRIEHAETSDIVVAGRITMLLSIALT